MGTNKPKVKQNSITYAICNLTSVFTSQYPNRIANEIEYSIYDMRFSPLFPKSIKNESSILERTNIISRNYRYHSEELLLKKAIPWWNEVNFIKFPKLHYNNLKSQAIKSYDFFYINKNSILWFKQLVKIKQNEKNNTDHRNAFNDGYYFL